MAIQGSNAEYEVGRKVAETSDFRLYLCATKSDDRTLMLQIASDTSKNGRLDRNALYLRMLSEYANKLEQEFAKSREDDRKFLNYDLAFPELIESFIFEEQGGRRVNVLGLKFIDDPGSMTIPLYNLVHKDKHVVDHKTNIWIFGKLLKIIDFAHTAQFSIEDVSLGNLLIEPDEHYVVVFNWLNAKYHDGPVPNVEVRKDIQSAAGVALDLLGNDAIDHVPRDEAERFEKYISFIKDLARHGHRNAHIAHQRFYELVDSLWEKKFHKFVSMRRTVRS